MGRRLPSRLYHTIEMVKAEIQDIEAFLCYQTLIFTGMRPEEHRTLVDYNTRNQSKLHLWMNLRGNGHRG